MNTTVLTDNLSEERLQGFMSAMLKFDPVIQKCVSMAHIYGHSITVIRIKEDSPKVEILVPYKYDIREIFKSLDLLQMYQTILGYVTESSTAIVVFYTTKDGTYISAYIYGWRK